MRKLFLLLIAFSAGASAQDELPPQTLFTNVHVWDGTSEGITQRINVLVENNTIKKIRANASDANAEAVIIDAPGKILMPGLINSHTHLNLYGLFFTLAGAQSAQWSQIGAQAAANARDQLMDGFTTIRDVCGMDDGLQKLIDQGTLTGPRIYTAGACISPTSGHGEWRAPNQRKPGENPSYVEQLGIVEIVDSADDMRAASRRNFSNGAHFLKLTAGGGVSSTIDPLWSVAFTAAELESAVEAAEFFDTYVMVHAYTNRTVTMALDAGVKVIDHGQMVTEDTVRRIAEDGIFWVTNLSGMTPDLLKHPNFATGLTREKLDSYQKESRNLVEYIKKHKPKHVFGVDVVLSPTSLARQTRDFEKHIFADWFGNHAMLVAATSTPGEMARLTGRRNPYPYAKLGVIEEGAYADILVIDGNPLDDISVIGANEKWFDAPPREEGIETIKLIMKDGKIYKNTL
jgi:imidazolonepropionase-like amidohydrolase